MAEWDDATGNAAMVILRAVLDERDVDEFLGWYKPEKWMGIHRAAGVFIRMKVDELRKSADEKA